MLKNKKSLRQNVGRAIERRLPILRWLPRYTLEDAAGDFVAGITVGLTLMPQAIAYAALAGLQSQYGLYAAFAGSFVYIIFGPCKEVNIGPTALLSLLTASYTQGTNADMAVLLCFLSGCVELLCGIFQLGFLVEFVSAPVVAGFTSAAALIIACSQLKGLLGLSFSAHGFLDNLIQLVRLAHMYSPGDLALGACCIVALLSLRKLKDVKLKRRPAPGSKAGAEEAGEQERHWAERALWFVSTARNATVVVLCAAIAFVLKAHDMLPFKLAGEIKPGLPPVSPPPFTTSWGNHTYTFPEMVAHLGSGIAVVPVIAILGNVAIAKAFASGAVVDATQEMTTLGLCNIAGSFFRSMPVCGSFSRSAVNNASGVRTPLGGLYTGVLVLLALSLLTPYFSYIPRATLSSVIICAVIFMVEAGTVMPIWRSNKRDLVPAFATFFACLFFGVEVGIVVGIAVDIAFLLYFNARPRVSVERISSPSGPFVLVTPGSGLLFPAVDFVRDAVARASADTAHDAETGVVNCAFEGLPGLEMATPTTPTAPASDDPPLPVVVSCAHMQRADFTAAQGLRGLVADLRRTGRCVVFKDAGQEVLHVLRQALQGDLLHAADDAELLRVLADLRQDMKSPLPMKEVTQETNGGSLPPGDRGDELDTRF